MLDKRTQHRHHRPRGRGQDHDHRADPVLQRHQAQGRRRRRRRHHHRLRPARTAEGHHDQLGRRLDRLGRERDQHHRHARPRRLHGRGRAVACASSTARVGVFCAVGGVEVQSETVWRQANKYKVPRIAYVNKLDRMGADFWACVEQMKTKLLRHPGDRHHPGRAGRRASKGIIDLIEMKFITRDATDKTNRKFFIDRHPGEVPGRGRQAPRAAARRASPPRPTRSPS